MADKEILDLTDGGAVQSGDRSHAVRSGNSREVVFGDAAGKNIPFTEASSSGPASLDFAEDTDNGSNKITLKGQAALGADIAVTLPAEAGTVVVGSASSTDNNIPRFDGTGGKLQAGSGLAISDTFDITASIPGGSEGTKYPAFLPRAFVNFNGTGTIAIRASGNVSSITDGGAGNYTPNFTSAMPDANYNAVGFTKTDIVQTHAYVLTAHPSDTKTTSAQQFRTTYTSSGSGSGYFDSPEVGITFVR